MGVATISGVRTRSSARGHGGPFRKNDHRGTTTLQQGATTDLFSIFNKLALVSMGLFPGNYEYIPRMHHGFLRLLTARRSWL